MLLKQHVVCSAVWDGQWCCKDYMQVIGSCSRGCTGYTTEWLARALLLCRTRSVHAQAFPTKGVGIAVLAQAGPDQNGWVTRLSRVGGGSQRLTVQQLLREVRFKGSAELFAMWACLCASVPTGRMIGCEAQLASQCQEFFSQTGWLPHPAILVQEFTRSTSE